MRLIVDTNIIVSALLRDSLTRKIILHSKAKLFTVEFSDEEIDKYKPIYIKRSGLTSTEFDIVLKALMGKLIPLDDLIITPYIQEAKTIMDHTDPNDTPFIAAALATNSAIWSDDKHFQQQKHVKIYTTKDLIEISFSNMQ